MQLSTMFSDETWSWTRIMVNHFTWQSKSRNKTPKAMFIRNDWNYIREMNFDFYNLVQIIMKTHVLGFFDTDLHEVSWHGRVGSKFNWPSEDQCQRSHLKWVLVFIPHLKSKYNQLIVSKLSRKSAMSPRRSTWRLIVLVRSLRSARLDTAWLVKSVTYFNLIG